MLLIQLVFRLSSNAIGIYAFRIASAQRNNQTNCSSSARGYAVHYTCSSDLLLHQTTGLNHPKSCILISQNSQNIQRRTNRTCHSRQVRLLARHFRNVWICSLKKWGCSFSNPNVHSSELQELSFWMECLFFRPFCLEIPSSFFDWNCFKYEDGRLSTVRQTLAPFFDR